LNLDLDLDLFERAWSALIAQHESLRAGFEWQAGGPVMRVEDRVICAIEHLHWIDVDDHTAIRQRLASYLATERQRGFNVAQPPLMRLAVIHRAARSPVFVWTHHHLILDARAIRIVLRELSSLYLSLRSGQEPSLPAAPGYRQHLHPAEAMDSSDGSAFWRALLEAPLPARRSPFVDIRGCTETTPSSMSSCAVDVGLSAHDLASVAASCDVTTNTIVQLAWVVMLGRYADERDVIVGVIRACRQAGPPALRQVVGVRANAVPVRLRWDPHTRVRAALRDLRAQHLAVRPHERDSLSRIREWCGIRGQGELFDTLVVFDTESLAAAVSRESACPWQSDLDLISYTHYPVTLVAHERPRPAFRIDYDPRAVDRGVVTRMAGHLATVLEQVVADADRLVCDLHMSSAAERAQMVDAWNATTQPFPDRTAHALFEAQVARTPAAIAISHGGQRITYGVLNARANQLAQALGSCDVRGGRVAICIERSIDMIVAILATLKAGAAYLPLDTTYPDERIRFMLDDAAPTVVLTTQALAHRFVACGRTVVCVDCDASVIARDDIRNPDEQGRADDLAYVIYTSGSTGTPKGIVLPHRALTNLVAWYGTALPSGATTLQYASLSFDMASYEIFSTLCHGGRLVLIADQVRRDVAALAQVIDAAQVETAMLPGVVLDQIAQYCGAETTWLPSLRDVITAGEQLQITPAMIAFFATTGCRLHNHYGPSETGPIVSAYTLAGEPASWPVRPPIGRPIANVRLYVLDSRGQPVSMHVAGELCIGGVSLARGYWQQPALTDERFVRHAMTVGCEERLYHTGDIARWRADGVLEYLGRRDAQIKVRGYRVEPGEIESLLQQQPGVAQAVVVATSGGTSLTAYIVAANGDTCSPQRLRAALGTRLPEHMVPTRWVPLEALPLTASGKVDRRALPPAAGDSRDELGTYAAPRTSMEALLAAIWADALGVDRVGIHDNFFDLGGHSLSAMRVLNRVRAISRTPADVAPLWQCPTVGSFAAHLRDRESPQDQSR
jgi:amino acid adenylation domain-containing protein